MEVFSSPPTKPNPTPNSNEATANRDMEVNPHLTKQKSAKKESLMFHQKPTTMKAKRITLASPTEKLFYVVAVNFEDGNNFYVVEAESEAIHLNPEFHKAKAILDYSEALSVAERTLYDLETHKPCKVYVHKVHITPVTPPQPK
jgi:hypothetical protein